jgi:hypothetical protein
VSGTVPIDPASSLRSLRRLWLGVAGGVVLLTLIVLATSDADSTVPAALTVVLTVAVAVGALAGVVTVDRTFATSAPVDDATAIQELRTRAFLQLAILEAPVLLGVALGFALGPPWVAAVGAAGALVALVVSRPTQGRLAGFDRSWRSAGRDVSLLRTLGVPPADG